MFFAFVRFALVHLVFLVAELQERGGQFADQQRTHGTAAIFNPHLFIGLDAEFAGLCSTLEYFYKGGIDDLHFRLQVGVHLGVGVLRLKLSKPPDFQ